jgi:nitrogen fixation/metabolism regulation signal transduction histidine kinase
VSLLVVAPGMITALLLIFHQNWTNEAKWSLTAGLIITWLILEAILHDQVIRPLQTLTNVISSLREDDYSFRARGAVPNDALGDLAIEINALADSLADQKTHAVEATELLKRVVEEIDTPLFTFDPNGRLRLVNSAGTRLLQQSKDELLGRTAAEIGLAPFLQSDQEAPISALNPNARWLVRRTSFREKGVPHTLIVLSDVSRALREEERSAWQRLIRVLGHELNNSLAPIKSIAGTLAMRLQSLPVAEDERQDFVRGLGIIETRSESLNRFLQAYRKLAQMPAPSLRPVHVSELVGRVAALESRVPISVNPGPEITALLDPDQIEQMMINLIKNAAEASLESVSHASYAGAEFQPEVKVSWSTTDSKLAISVTDNGPGLLNPDNVFVPFYTTKSAGAGVGLVLCRQIAEAHSGAIQLKNRRDSHGCVATVILPLS